MEAPLQNSHTEVHSSSELFDSEAFIRSAFQHSTESGFNLVFKRYHGVLCSHAHRFVLDKDIAQDIVSDVFLNFWKHQDFAKIQTTYRAYLFRAVRNGCINYINRQMHRTARLDDATLPLLTSSSPEEIFRFDELQHKIDETIAALPPQCRRAFMLSRFEDKKYHEIAVILGIAPKTVEMHISKAFAVLKTLAKKHDWVWGIFFFWMA